MARIFRDHCLQCQETYVFNADTDSVLTFDDNKYNHIYAICPNCGNKCMIFINTETLDMIAEDEALPFHHRPEPDDDVKAMYDELIGQPDETDEPSDDSAYGEVKNHADPYSDLPWPSRDMLIELWDFMREFGGESKMNGQCTTKGCGLCASNGPVRIPTKSW